MLIDDILINGKFGNRISEVSIKKYHYNEWVNICNFSEKYSYVDIKWTQKVLNYIFNITELPKCLCGSNLNFRGRIGSIYTKYCSNRCASIYNSEERMKTLKDNNLKKWGVENVFQLDSTKEKSRKTCLDKYGVDNINKSKIFRDDIEKTNIERYGVKTVLILPKNRIKMIEKSRENWGDPKWVNWFKKILIDKNGGVGFGSESIRNKYKSFCIKKWGVENAFQSDEIKLKIKEFYMSKYGVSNPQQVQSIHDRSVMSSFYCKKYKNSNLYYQGKYELDFLEKYYDKFEILRGKSIKYNFDGIDKVYYPDFYLPKYDITIEIKSDYTFFLDLDRNLSKMKHMFDNNINFIIILNKDYNEFEKIVML